MRLSLSAFIFLILSPCLASAQQMVSISGRLPHTSDPKVIMYVPVDGNFSVLSKKIINIDTATETYQASFPLTRPGILLLQNYFEPVMLYVQPGKKYVVDIDFSTEQAQKTIGGEENEGNTQLQKLAQTLNSSTLYYQLEHHTTPDSAIAVVEAVKAGLLQPFLQLLKEEKIGKEFYNAAVTEANARQTETLSAHYYFKSRETIDDTVGDASKRFAQIYLPAWKKMYGNLADSVQLLRSSVYPSIFERYSSFRGIEMRGYDVIDENYVASKLAFPLQSGVKGIMAEYMLASAIEDIYGMNNFNKELIASVKTFKGKYPKSLLLPELLDIAALVETFHANAKKNNPKIKFVKNAANIKTRQQLYKIFANNKGRITYVDLWATWCGPCRLEMNYSIPMHDEYEKMGVQMAYISFDRDADAAKWRQIAKSLQLQGYNMMASKELQEDLGSSLTAFDGIPRYLIIAPDGTLINEDALRPSDQLALLKQLKQYAAKYKK